MNLDPAVFAKITPTLNSDYKASGDTCDLFTTEEETCEDCPLFYKHNNRTCFLLDTNPEYRTFLRTHFPELLI